MPVRLDASWPTFITWPALWKASTTMRRKVGHSALVPMTSCSRGEILDRQRRLGGERMAGRQQRHQPVARDRPRLDLRALERAFDEAEVDLVLQDLVALRGRSQVGQFEADIRIGQAEFARDVGHQRMAGDRRVADAQDRLGAGGEQAGGVFGDVDAAENLLRFLQQITPGLGQPDLARRAFEKLDAEPVLQFQHDPADCRLRHGQPLGGAVEVEFLRHRDEGRQMLQIVSHIDNKFVFNRMRNNYFTSKAWLSSTYAN